MTTRTMNKKRTQEERSRISTEKLIEACIELASEKGAAAITFDMIGERAGYSRNLAFQKFGSKSALLEAVVNHLHDKVEEARARAGQEDLSGLEAIYIFCETQFMAPDDCNVMRAYSILLSSAIADLSEALPLFERSHQRSEKTLKRLLTKGIADGSVREDTDILQASLLIGTQLLGISSQSIVDQNFSLPRALAEFRKVLAMAYGTPKAAQVLLEKPLPVIQQ